MFLVDPAKACCRGLTPLLFGYTVWGAPVGGGGAGANLFLLLFTDVKGSVKRLLQSGFPRPFCAETVFNHDLYKHEGEPAFSVVAVVGHWEPFTGLRFYFKWSVDPSKLSKNPSANVCPILVPVAQRLNWIDSLYCSWERSLYLSSPCVAVFTVNLVHSGSLTFTIKPAN